MPHPFLCTYKISFGTGSGDVVFFPFFETSWCCSQSLEPRERPSGAWKLPARGGAAAALGFPLLLHSPASSSASKQVGLTTLPRKNAPDQRNSNEVHVPWPKTTQVVKMLQEDTSENIIAAFRRENVCWRP